MELLEPITIILPKLKTVLLAIVPLGFLIFIHELGHFLAAKRAGIKVNIFSIGFGPKLFGVEYDGTEYRLSVLPFGGYVMMEGENPTEQTGAKGEFGSAPLGSRAFVVAAGPAVNLIFGVFAFWLVFNFGLNNSSATFIERLIGQRIGTEKEAVQLGTIAPDGPGAFGGLKSGDIIKTINGAPIENWTAFHTRIFTSPGQELEVTVERTGTEQTFTVVPEGVRGARGDSGVLQVSSRSKVMVTEVAEGSLAAQVGIQAGDRVETINGQKIYNVPQFNSQIWHPEANWLSRHYQALYHSVQRHPEELHLGIRRGDIAMVVKVPVQWELTAIVPPEAAGAGVHTGDTLVSLNGKVVENAMLSAQLWGAGERVELGLIRDGKRDTVELLPHARASDEVVETTGVPYGFGWNATLSGMTFGPPPRDLPTYNLFTAFGKGLEASWLTVETIGRTLRQLISQEVSPKFLTGPIGIANITSRMFDIGFSSALFFIGFISVNLCVVNLLPIPIADGGQLMFFAFEKIRGRPLSLKKQALVQRVSVVLMIALFLYITWFDGLSLIHELRN